MPAKSEGLDEFDKAAIALWETGSVSSCVVLRWCCSLNVIGETSLCPEPPPLPTAPTAANV